MFRSQDAKFESRPSCLGKSYPMQDFKKNVSLVSLFVSVQGLFPSAARGEINVLTSKAFPLYLQALAIGIDAAVNVAVHFDDDFGFCVVRRLLLSRAGSRCRVCARFF